MGLKFPLPASHQMTAPYVHQCLGTLMFTSWRFCWKIYIDYNENNLLWTDACRKFNPHFKWSSRHLRSLIRSVFLQMTELAGINENVADDNMSRACLLHMSLPHNYATTRSTDRLSSINLLRNTNWGLLLYVVTSGCCLRHASWMSTLLELHRHTSSDGKTLTFTYS